MPDIRIHRAHELGLPKARKVAQAWAEQAESKYGLQCSHAEGSQADVVEFRRSGVNGSLHVAKDHFELNAKLGFLLGAFRGSIEKEIEGILDELLAQAPVESAPKPARRAAPAKKRIAATKKVKKSK